MRIGNAELPGVRANFAPGAGEAGPAARLLRVCYLQAPDGRDVYFHRNSVPDGDFPKLSLGARVTFVEEMGEKGAQASTVRLTGKHGLRL